MKPVIRLNQKSRQIECIIDNDSFNIGLKGENFAKELLFLSNGFIIFDPLNQNCFKNNFKAILIKRICYKLSKSNQRLGNFYTNAIRKTNWPIKFVFKPNNSRTLHVEVKSYAKNRVTLELQENFEFFSFFAQIKLRQQIQSQQSKKIELLLSNDRDLTVFNTFLNKTQLSFCRVVYEYEENFLEHLYGYNNNYDFYFDEKAQHFQALNLPVGCAKEEIKKQYRKLAKKHHPDKVIHLGGLLQKLHEERFKIINQAYHELTA